MRTSAAVFPFCSQLLPFVKQFEELQDEYVLRKLVSPSGFGLTGRDAGYSRNHREVGLTVTDTLDPQDPTWDVLLLARTIGSEAVEPVELENEAERALQSRKPVLYLDSSSVHVPKKMWRLHTLDHILDRKDLAEADKIQELNTFFKNLEIKERPSVLLVEALEYFATRWRFNRN